MIQFNTLNTIIDDILLEARNNNIAESEQLSRIQIEQWIIQYRSLLIKQDIDKGRNMNPMYIQEMGLIEMDLAPWNLDLADNFDHKGAYSNETQYEVGDMVTYKGRIYKCISPSTDNNPTGDTTDEYWIKITDRTILKASIGVPDTIDFHFNESLVMVSDIDGNVIQLTSPTRALSNKNKRYSNNEYVCYMNGEFICIPAPSTESKLNDLSYIYVKGIFQNPMDSLLRLTADDPYPIPANMIPVLKEMIMTKEIDIVALSDITNDGGNDLNKLALNARDYKKLARGIK